MPSNAQSEVAKRGGPSLRLKISDVSRMLNISSSTLRQWENAGLTCPSRTESGYRTYSHADVEHLKQIQKLRIEKNLNIDAILHLLSQRRSHKQEAEPTKTHHEHRAATSAPEKSAQVDSVRGCSRSQVVRQFS